MKYLPSLPNSVIMTEDMTLLTSNSILDANIGNDFNTSNAKIWALDVLKWAYDVHVNFSIENSSISVY